MSYFYLDTSAVVKRYARETGTAWIRSLVRADAGHGFILSEITLAEVAAALAAKQRASGGLTRQERDDALTLFLRHCRTEYELVAASRVIIDRAVDLTQNHRLRGYDAVQLASALLSSETIAIATPQLLIFVSADGDLLAAAQGEGLVTENPDSHL